LRFLGPILETLDFKQLKWCGHGVGADYSYQFVEGEYMTADEYDHFLFDPTDFMMRKYWPRIFGTLKGLEKLTPMRNVITYSWGHLSVSAYTTLRSLGRAGHAEKSREKSHRFHHTAEILPGSKRSGSPSDRRYVPGPLDTLVIISGTSDSCLILPQTGHGNCGV
jgi:hypothetical protein